MKAFIFCITLLSFGHSLVGQNFLVSDSTSAYFFNSNIGKQDNSIFTSAASGYTIDGKLDISIVGGYSKLQQTAKFFFFSPRFDYLFVKQGKIPLSIGASASYEFKNFYESLGGLRHNSATLGPNIYHEFKINKNISTVPSAFGSINFVRRSFKDIEKDHIRFFEIGLQNSIRINNISISQRISFFQNTYRATLGLGIYFMRTSKIEPFSKRYIR